MEFSMHKSKIVLGVAVVAIGLGVAFKDTIQTQMYAYMHSSMHDRHGANGMGHDMKNMPGLRGANVTNLPNGIRTVTRSSDEDVMAVLVNHIVGMVDRVSRGDDPKIFIQSPTLDILFASGAEMQSQIDVTEEGIVVVRTSTDPDVVEALHVHAAEISDMADRGMQAVHDAMAQRADH
jgi:hypothetical protein